MAPACGFALVGRYPSKAKFRAIVIIYNRGAPGPAITLTKSCGRCPRRCVSRCFGQNAGRRRLQTSRISGRATTPPRELVPRHTITEDSRYFGRSLSSLSAGGSLFRGEEKGTFLILRLLPYHATLPTCIVRFVLPSTSICGVAPQVKISFKRFPSLRFGYLTKKETFWRWSDNSNVVDTSKKSWVTLVISNFNAIKSVSSEPLFACYIATRYNLTLASRCFRR